MYLKFPNILDACLLVLVKQVNQHGLDLQIRNKATVFQSPGYRKFIYCSPNFGESSLISSRDLEYQKCLREWAEPSEIIFLDHIVTEEELFEEAEAANGRILLIVDDFSQELFSTNLA